MSVNDQLQRAYQLIRAGNRQESVQVLMPILRADPANADAWWLLANAVTDPNQKKRALQEVLKLRPTDDRARRMLEQLEPPPPPPPVQSFDLDDDVFNDPPAAAPVTSDDVMPNWSSSTDTPASVSGSPSPIGADPFGSTGDPFGSSGDPYTPPPKVKNDAPPAYSPGPGYPAPNVPPAPVYMGPPPRKGPSCCLIFSCLFVVLFCAAPALCVGAGFAGLSPVFNEVARTAGAADFQGLISVISGQATPLPGSALDEAFDQLGVENFGQLQGTFEGLATVAGTPGIFETAAANLGIPMVGMAFTGDTTSRGNIEPGQTVNGTVEPGSAGDAWVITLGANETIRVIAEGDGSTDTTLAVVDSDNIVREFNDDGSSGTDAQLEFTPILAGKYTIVVGTFADQGGSYTLTVNGE